MNEKTFIILTPGFPESEADTVCLPMQQSFVRTLKDLFPGIEIIVLSFQYPYHQKRYKWFDIDVIPFDGRNKGGFTKLLLRKKINSTLDKLRRTNNIIGLFSFWYNECAWVGKKFADKNNIKHYCWILGQDARKENKYPEQLVPQPGELIALSDFLQREFEKNHGTRPRWVVPPGIDASIFKTNTTEKDIDLLAVGSLIPLKQYEIFIEVFDEIKKQIPGIKAVLIGKGPEKKKLQSLIDKLDVKENIHLAGELPYDKVIAFMQRTKVFLHPSSYEGFGCVCAEALCAKAYVISFCKPINETIPHWLIVKTKEEMIDEAIKIIKNKQTVYKSIVPYSMTDTVKTIMKRFGED
jgi:glycosyltransferase involved in cell wall biosynthesis